MGADYSPIPGRTGYLKTAARCVPHRIDVCSDRLRTARAAPIRPDTCLLPGGICYNRAFANFAIADGILMTTRFLPDTRPYPTDPVKNELLLHAGAVATNASKAQSTLAWEALQAGIYGMLQQRHLLGLSVALSMAPDAAAYRVLWRAMDAVLEPKTEAERSWVALPVVVVAGCKQAAQLRGELDTAGLRAQLAAFPATAALAELTWLPHLLSAEQMAGVKLDGWFAAKQNDAAARAFAEGFGGARPLAVPEGQSVHVVYALGYGRVAALPSLGEAALPMMQYWQQHFAAAGLTLFANPLDPAAPLGAISEGSHMRQRMALDVFAAKAIRAVRLQSPRVGVVAAAAAGGVLAFGFNAAESAFGLVPQVFRWHLSPTDFADTVVQNFLDLMAECQVEHIRLLTDPLPEGAGLPDYAAALNLPGYNPLFSQPH